MNYRSNVDLVIDFLFCNWTHTMDLTFHSFLRVPGLGIRQNIDNFSLTHLLVFPAPGLSTCLPGMTPKAFHMDTHFPTFTNWQLGRYHLSDVATPNSAILMERKSMCCVDPSSSVQNTMTWSWD
ncbi:hypothetical protein VTL71DRAFT_12465 [Oculimacula yallundae]|uniref:Uncharacterized protein n=1 Tax=Oculimacula yallundae TaxID=86028 RepID=A0ABR4CN47_9HELO